MSFPVSKNILITVFFGFLLLITITSFAQSDDHTDQRLKADALAFAYVKCDLALAKYHFTLDPDNDETLKKIQTLSKLESQMSVNTFIRYREADQKKKLEREIKAARKKLNKCIKYQNILDAKAVEEKQKAKEEQ